MYIQEDRVNFYSATIHCIGCPYDINSIRSALRDASIVMPYLLLGGLNQGYFPILEKDIVDDFDDYLQLTLFAQRNKGVLKAYKDIIANIRETNKDLLTLPVNLLREVSREDVAFIQSGLQILAGTYELLRRQAEKDKGLSGIISRPDITQN